MTTPSRSVKSPVPLSSPDPFTLHYRVGFLVLTMASGLIMLLLGIFIVIACVVLFRPAAIILGIFLTLAGLRVLRRYGGAVRRRQACFRLDRDGLHYDSRTGYSIGWNTVLGLHACRRGDRVTDLYVYLTESPASALFAGETDPRAGILGSHRPESPNQLHLRLTHLAVGNGEAALAAFQAFAPNHGAFPPDAQVFDGHLSSMNWVLLTTVMTLAFGVVAFSVAIGVATPFDGVVAFLLMQMPAVLVYLGASVLQRRRNWMTPRLILRAGRLYTPGAALGSVKVSDILNVRQRGRALTLVFNKPQESVRNYSYNRYGMYAHMLLFFTPQTRQSLAEVFGKLGLWNNGKKVDLKKIKAKFF